MRLHVITTNLLQPGGARWSCSCGSQGHRRHETEHQAFQRGSRAVHNLENGRGRIPHDSLVWVVWAGPTGKNTMRTGHIPTVDATLSHHRQVLVRECDDGTIEYLIGDSAARRDGWAALPADLVGRVKWDPQEGK